MDLITNLSIKRTIQWYQLCFVDFSHFLCHTHTVSLSLSYRPQKKKKEKKEKGKQCESDWQWQWQWVSENVNERDSERARESERVNEWEWEWKRKWEWRRVRMRGWMRVNLLGLFRAVWNRFLWGESDSEWMRVIERDSERAREIVKEWVNEREAGNVCDWGDLNESSGTL
jgi:hypothetical protein